MYPRTLEQRLLKAAKRFPAISLTGPRQSGKTTLVQHCFPNHHYVSLEDPDHREFAVEDPRGFLGQFNRGVILDEVQKVPDLFSYLQSAIDRDRVPGQWILTGSQNFLLMSRISQTLAGRVAITHLYPLTVSELSASVAMNRWQGILFSGLYPAIHAHAISPGQWYGSYIQTYLERDVRDILNIGNLNAFSKFLRIAAGRAGQLLSMNSMAVDCGISQPTVKSWLSVLEAAGMILLLQPFHTNFTKRQIKAPKLYWIDTGLLCYLLRIRKQHELDTHASKGALFENFIVAELFKTVAHSGSPDGIFFWRDRSGHEIDAVIERSDSIRPIEIKASATVRKDHFKNLAFWRELAQGRTAEGVLINAGRKEYKRSDHLVIPWNRAGRIIEAGFH